MILYYEKIKDLRKATGLQTKIFCERMGISVSTLWHWEKGSKTPPEKKVRKLAKVLGVSVEDISDLTSEYKKSDHDLSGIIGIWSSTTEANNKETEYEFKKMINLFTKQYNSLMQYSLITKAILSSINSVIYIKDVNLKYLVANKAFLNLLSLNEKYRVEGKTDEDFFTINESVKIKNQDEKVIAAGKPLVNIHGVMPGSKKKKYALISKFPIFDSEQKVAGVIATYNDITEMRKASRTREILEIYIGAMTDCLSVFFSENYKYIYVNNAYADIFGYPVEDFYKGGLMDFFAKTCVHPDDKKQEERYLRTKKWPNSRKFRIIKPNGEIRWLEGSVNKRVYMGKECCISVNRDITDRVYKSAFYDMIEFILNSSSDVLWIKENKVNGKFLYVSESVNRLYGYPVKNFCEDPEFIIDKCIEYDNYSLKEFFKTGVAGNSNTAVGKVISKAGDVRWIEVKCFKKEYLGKLCLCFIERDITIRKKIEENQNIDIKFEIAKKLFAENMPLEKVSSITDVPLTCLKSLQHGS